MTRENYNKFQTIIESFAMNGFVVIDYDIGEFRHFKLSSPPVIILQVPMDTKIVGTIIKFFYNICDIKIGPDFTGASLDDTAYYQMLCTPSDPFIVLTMPDVILSKIKTKSGYNDILKEYFDIFENRMVLFEQKMLSIKN